MTKEELEKEIRKYLKKTFYHEYYDDVVKVMGFAEPREKRIAELEKENAKLKEFVNAPHTKGRKTTRGDYIKTVWDLSKQLTKAKELLKQWLQTSKANSCDNINIVTDTEQFLNEVEK